MNKKNTLLTNIDFVTMQPGVRLEAHAILIEENCGLGLSGEPQYRVRGFGMSATWPVFTLWLNPSDFPFKIKSANSTGMAEIIGEGGKLKPIYSGSYVQFIGTPLFLQASDESRPLDIVEEPNILTVWRILEEKTAEYWMHPNMPVIHYRPKV